MLKKVDDFIFDNPIGFQRISEVVEYVTHMSHTVQARIVALLCFGYAATKQWRLFIEYPDESSLFGFIVLNILMFLVLIQSMLVESQTKNPKFRNPYREKEVFRTFRFMFIILLAVRIPEIFHSGEFWKIAQGAGMVAVVYLLACQRLPPGDRFFSKKTAPVHS